MIWVHRAVLLIGFAAFCQAADIYTVGGVILNHATNTPLHRARVEFYRSLAAKPVASTITGDDGRFQFHLPAGSYVMRAGTRDTTETYGSAHAGSALASAVIVGSGKDTGNLIFHFFPPSAISGRVTDDAGEPVQEALVQLIRSYVSAGRRTTSVFAYERTNDTGEYRFGHLPGDTVYYIAVTGMPWYSRSLPATLPGSQPAAAYAPVYYPGTPDASRATPLNVRQGEEAHADFTLNTVTNANVNVEYDAPPNLRGTVSLTYDGIAGTIATQQNQQLVVLPARPNPELPRIGPDQKAALSSVPPGRYTVRISGVAGISPLGASAPVEINGADQTVALTLKPYPKIAGSVHFSPGVSPRGTLTAALRNLSTGAITRATVQRDGTFTFPAVAAGHFRFSLGGPDGFYAAQITSPSESVQGGIVTIPEQGEVDLSISASNETGRLRGFAVDGDKPLEGVFVILMAASGKAADSDDDVRISTYQTESDGSFDFRAVPAGRYHLFAVNDPELEYSVPAIAAPYLAGAMQIDISAHTTAEESVPLTVPAAQ